MKRHEQLLSYQPSNLWALVVKSLLTGLLMLTGSDLNVNGVGPVLTGSDLGKPLMC